MVSSSPTAYYNEARILDPVTFATISILPNMPGAVNDCEFLYKFLAVINIGEVTAGRTYPLAGALVPLPQFYPYRDPLQVLICGGSTIGGGYALDNCITIAPEAPNPTWTLERMVWQELNCSLPSFADVQLSHHDV